MARWREKPLRLILEELPPQLQRSASPERCLCSGCYPGLLGSDRLAAECAMEAWRQARLAWCAEHGVSFLDLIQAERQARRERAQGEDGPSVLQRLRDEVQRIQPKGNG